MCRVNAHEISKVEKSHCNGRQHHGTLKFITWNYESVTRSVHLKRETIQVCFLLVFIYTTYKRVLWIYGIIDEGNEKKDRIKITSVRKTIRKVNALCLKDVCK